MKKKFLAMAMLLLLTIVMAVAFTSCGGDDSNGGGAETDGDVTVWKLAHSESTDTMYDRYAHKFADLVEEKSDGRIQVDIYPVSSLGDTASQVEMLMNGSIQLGIFASSDVGDLFPAVQALSLNFVFSDDNAVNAQILTEGKATAALDEMFAERNLVTYDWFTLGNMQWGSATVPIRTVDDFDGFKMRIMSSPLLSANYEAFGATPTPLAFTETYSGLQLGTVDGTEQPMNAMEEMKFYEVLDYITMSNHAQMASFMSMNGDFYNSLSDEDKAMLEEIKEELRPFALETLETLLQEKTDIILETKPELEIIELTDEERQAFIDASMPVRDQIEEFAGEEGREIFNLLLEDVETYSN